MGTKAYQTGVKSRIAGAVSAAPSAAELAFFRRPETKAWWDASATYGQHLTDRSADRAFWTDRKSGLDLAISGTLVPNYIADGGPNSQPILKGRTTGATPDSVVTPSGNSPVAAGSLCIWAVAKAGIGSASPLFMLAGNNGGGVSVRMRNSDLIQLFTEADNLVFQSRISQTLSGSAFHLVQVNYKHGSPGNLNIYADGAKLTGGTPSSGDYAYTHGFPSNRMSWFGEYDQADGFGVNMPRELAIAMCGVATTYAPENAAWQAALVAMVSERFPSLGL